MERELEWLGVDKEAIIFALEGKEKKLNRCRVQIKCEYREVGHIGWYYFLENATT